MQALVNCGLLCLLASTSFGQSDPSPVKVVPAGLTTSDGAGIRAAFADGGAPSLSTFDPVVQQAYLKASNTDIEDFFGRVVAVSGDTVVVGAPEEDSNATGVGGDEDNDSATESGAVYVFVRSGTTWSQQAYLKASNTDSDDAFGRAVAIDGDTLVVGASGEDSTATGVDGPDNDFGTNTGAAYVFVRSGTTWGQQAYLKASNTGSFDQFGSSVCVSGDTVVVGAANESSNATGVNGTQNDNSAAGAGAAYVFVRSGTTWSQQAYLKASNTDDQDFFGSSVSVAGDTVVVGAVREESGATGVGGAQADNSAGDAGAAYVFTRSGTTWSQQAYLKASNTGSGDNFGASVAVAGDTVVVGATREDSSSSGVDGDQSDNSAGDAGAAYVFTRSGSAWSQQAYIKASNPDALDRFGQSVSVSDDTLVVGAHLERSSATGVDGDQSDNSLPFVGAAYVFGRSGTTWWQQAYLKASNAGGGDQFGIALSLSGDTLVVGADRERSSATGVDGDDSDDGALWAGAAYTFVLDLDPWDDLGEAVAGTHGDPELVGTGTLGPSTPMSIILDNAKENEFAVLFVGFSALNFAGFYGGTLVPDFNPPGFLHIVNTGPAGSLTLGTTWPALASGFEIYLQYWINDAAGPFGLAGSNALRGTVP